MLKQLLTVACVVFASFNGMVANAALINVRFGDNDDVTYSGAAVIGTAGDVWNHITVNNSTGNALVSSTGGSTGGVTFDLSSLGVGTLIGAGGPFDGGPYQNLFGGQTAANGDGITPPTSKPISIVFHNLVPGAYDLYVISGTNYPTFGQARALTVSANGSTPITIGPNGGATTLVEGTNWIRLQPVVGIDGLLTITGTLGGGDEGDLNGLQLISAVPEPTGIAMISLAAIGLMGIRRRCR